MKKIVFVDDEYEVRQSIVNLIDWKKYDFELVAQASNGQEALNVIEATHPDVVLTDIRMPIMDGLALSKAIKEFDPTIKIIILSGYENFGFAQSAIRLNIHAYLLKPVSKQDLEEVLQQVSQAIDEERENAYDIFKLTKEYMENLDILKQSFFMGLLTQTHRLEEEGRLRNIAQLYQMTHEGDMRIVTVTLMQDSPIEVSNQITHDSQDQLFTEELKWVAYTRLLREITKRYTTAYVYRMNYTIVLLISMSEHFTQDELDMLLIEIEQSFWRHYDVEIVMGISSIFNRLIDTKHAYQQSMNAINYGRQFRESAVVYNSDIEVTSDSIETEFEVLSEQLFVFLGLGNVQAVTDQFKRISQLLHSTFLSSDEYFTFVLEIVTKAIKIYRQTVKQSDQSYIDAVMDQTLRSRTDYLEVMLMTLEQNLLHITQIIKENRDTTKESLTTKGIKLIRQHFSNPEFNQKMLAEMLHISPNYLSSLFKKETGKPFREHLIETRLNHAQMLLLSTDKKLPEIAELSGYIDQHYFSYGFKKHFGQSPRQMREDYRRQQ